MPVARHREKNITLHRQGDINYLLNAGKDGHTGRFIERHGIRIDGDGVNEDGFGEANFRALFESTEEDWIRRGVP